MYDDTVRGSDLWIVQCDQNALIHTVVNSDSKRDIGVIICEFLKPNLNTHMGSKIEVLEMLVVSWFLPVP
jgi:hypothetical protein